MVKNENNTMAMRYMVLSGVFQQISRGGTVPFCLRFRNTKSNSIKNKTLTSGAKSWIYVFLMAMCIQVHAQEMQNSSRQYIGVAFGTSFALGDFGDTDVSNPSAGFARNGRRIDVYGGHYFGENKKLALTGAFRYQTFQTKIEEMVSDFKMENPAMDFESDTEDWQFYSLLVGLAHKVEIGSKYAFYPRFGVGPLWATNPGISISAPNAPFTQVFERSSKTGLGLTYEIGIGLNKDIGRHLALMPTFTFSGGIATVKDLLTTTDNISVKGDHQHTFQSFNLGLSVAYKIYK